MGEVDRDGVVHPLRARFERETGYNAQLYTYMYKDEYIEWLEDRLTTVEFIYGDVIKEVENG